MEMNPWGCRCWLLCSPRSGSTYLQFLLNQAAGVPLGLSDDRELSRYSFGEHLHEKRSKDFADFLLWNPVVSKVHCHHFGQYLVDKQEILRLYPDIRFVLLERKNLFAQAVSLAYADITGVTQVEDDKELASLVEVEITDEQLLASYQTVKDYFEFWRNWLHDAPYLVVSYEQLRQRPEQIVGMICDYLQTPYKFSDDVPLLKMARPDTGKYVERLTSLRHSRCRSRFY